MTIDTRTRWLALIVLCLGDLMIVLDTTIVNVALPSIREDLGFSETSLAWVVNAYLLTFGGFLLLGGRLGDLFGHRRLFLVGIALFTGASLACGLATTQALLVARAGGAGARRRGRLGGRALADHDPVHRAGRAGEGDGRLRLRRRRRRQHRRAARRRPDRRPQLALDLPRQRADRRRRLSSLSLRLLPAGRGSQARGRGLDVAGAVTVTASLMLAVYAIVNGNEAGWTSGADARPARRRGRAAGALPRDRGAGRVAARAARALPAAQRRDRERRRRPLGGGHVRLVLPLRALPAARARLQPARGRSRLPAGQPDHGRVLARPLREARACASASGRRSRPGCCWPRSGSCSSRARRSTAASPSTCCRA